MAAVTIRSDFGAQENKICNCFHFPPFYGQFSHAHILFLSSSSESWGLMLIGQVPIPEAVALVKDRVLWLAKLGSGAHSWTPWMRTMWNDSKVRAIL